MNIQIELGEHNNNGFLKELKPALYGGPFSSKLLKHFLGKRTKFSLFFNQSGVCLLGQMVAPSEPSIIILMEI